MTQSPTRCLTQKEGKQINKLLNKLQNKSSEYIDCNTPKIKRKTIIEKYKCGELPFLVNVKILVEGFDAPITKGVCFMHLSCIIYVVVLYSWHILVYFCIKM